MFSVCWSRQRTCLRCVCSFHFGIIGAIGAAYPLLQGYWGNQARIRGFPGVQTQGIMAGETGGDREGPSPPGHINSISWVGPGGPNI